MIDSIKSELDKLCEKQKELDYLMIIGIVKENSIVWPQSEDSQLWNDRMTRLLHCITEKFGFDGENE